jgi:hypothetical protein
MRLSGIAVTCVTPLAFLFVACTFTLSSPLPPFWDRVGYLCFWFGWWAPPLVGVPLIIFGSRRAA